MQEFSYLYNSEECTGHMKAWDLGGGDERGCVTVVVAAERNFNFSNVELLLDSSDYFSLVARIADWIASHSDLPRAVSYFEHLEMICMLTFLTLPLVFKYVLQHMDTKITNEKFISDQIPNQR